MENRYVFTEDDIRYLNNPEEMILFSYKVKIKERKALGENWRELQKAERKRIPKLKT